MKIKYASVDNFGSFKSLYWNYSPPLSLVSGPTGAGKSTMLDMVPWILYGETAKGVTADAVKSWIYSDRDTEGHICLDLEPGYLAVCRIRGKRNDLFFVASEEGEIKRGKDLKDTQALINQILKVSPALYNAAAYAHEFSPSASFFISSAKTRRESLEQMADLTLPNTISKRATEAIKTSKGVLEDIQTSLTADNATLASMTSTLDSSQVQKTKWYSTNLAEVAQLMSNSKNYSNTKTATLAELETRRSNFETLRHRRLQGRERELTSLTDHALPTLLNREKELRSTIKCAECGAIKKIEQEILDRVNAEVSVAKQDTKRRAEISAVMENLQREINPYVDLIDKAEKQSNPFEALALAAAGKENPWEGHITSLQEKKKQASDRFYDTMAKQNTAMTHHASLVKLQSLAGELRGAMLTKVCKELNVSTNKYLTDHFDAEILIEFTLDKDNLEVKIFKSGYECEYKQLSKGQRTLLKLCFTASVMRASANQAGIHFYNLSFDESLDGLSETLKIKAYGLFQSLILENHSVMVVDHSENLKEMFEKVINVKLAGDCSEIIEAARR